MASSGTVTFFKGWGLTGNYTAVDLVAASTNALNGRPMLGRKLKGKSQRELRDLGLLVNGHGSPVVVGAEPATQIGEK